MSRKNSIIIITAIILIIIGGLLFLYFSSNNKNTSTNTSPSNTNPFGNTSAIKTSTSTQPTLGNSQNQSSTQTVSKLTQIYKNPTSGTVFFVNKNNQDVLRFVDRAVGNIYEYIPETQTSQPQRITNTTITKIQQSVWSNSGNNLVYRYLNNDTDNISSFSGTINTSSVSQNSIGQITGLFLSSNIKEMATNPKGDTIFNLVDKSDKSGTFGFTTDFYGGSKKVVLDSPISYWNIAWPKDDTITLTTKPTYRDYGLLYFFNPQTYTMNRILGNMMGLSTLTNKNANLVAYSYNKNLSLLLDIYDVKNKVSKNLQLPTFADKCVWGNNNPDILYCAVPQTINVDNYPDAWYQGTEAFSDNIWSINTETGNIQQIYQVGLNEDANVDAYDLKISADDHYLTFSNKNDLSLWILNLGN